MVEPPADHVNRRSVIKTLSGLGVVGLAGCIGDDQDDDDGGVGSDDDDGGSAPEEATWSFAGNREGSWLFSAAASLATAIENSELSDRITLQPQPTPGFDAATQRMIQGEFDMGWSSQAPYWRSVQGLDPHPEPVDEPLQAISPTVHQSGQYYMARESTGIETWEDLEGASFTMTSQGSAQVPVTTRLLQEVGVYDSMDIEYNDFDSIRSGWIEGRFDAALVFMADGWVNLPHTVEMTQQEPGVHLPMPQDALEATLEDFQAWNFKQPSRDFWDEELMVDDGDTVDYIFTSSQVFMAPHVGEEASDLVYELTEKLVAEANAGNFDNIHPSFQTFGFGDSPAPPYDERFGFDGIHEDTEFHPGAREFYEDEGIPLPGE